MVQKRDANGNSKTNKSVQSQNQDDGIVSMKRFTEINRLQDAVKLYSTLEDSENEGPRFLQIAGIQGKVLESIYENFNYANQNSNMFVRWKELLLKKVFQINYVLLDTQAVTPTIYHFITLLHFIQIIFYIFYNVTLTNEFSVQSNDSGAPATFQIYNYIEFMNFHLYTLGSSDSTAFLAMYVAMNATFYLFLIILFAMSDQLFNNSKNGGLKEFQKYIVSILSIFMTAFIYLLQIPIVSLNLQGFLCEEVKNNAYTLEVQCGSVQHSLTTFISTVTLVIYIVFLIVERLLYTSRSFETHLPWGSLERNLDVVKVLIKLVLSFSFMFDKAGTTAPYIHILCFMVLIHVIYNRLTKAIIFDQSIYLGTIWTETMKMTLFLNISCLQLSGTEITITLLIVIVSVGFLACIICVLAQEKIRLSYLRIANHDQSLLSVSNYETYFFRFFELIKSKKIRDKHALKGILFSHLHICEKDKELCKCTTVAQKMDGLNSIRKILKNVDQPSSSKQDVTQESRVSMTSRYFESHKDLSSIEKDPSMIEFFDKQQTSGIFMKDRSARIKKLSNASSHASQDFKIKKLESFKKPQMMEELSSVIKKPKYLAVEDHQMIGQVDYKQEADVESSYTKKSKEATKQDEISLLRQWEQRKRSKMVRMKALEDQFEQEDTQLLSQQHKVERYWYQFFALLVKDAIIKFPKSAYLKLLNSYLQRSKLKNEFLAIFEALLSENCNPSLQEKFLIFQRKVEIEKSLNQRNECNASVLGNLDIKQVYNYERQFQHYALLEYVTANSALSFWRELLQKDIKASVMQLRGAEISKNYILIQEVAKDLMKIYPQEMKFMYRYSQFLRLIVNNEYEAINLLQSACMIYQIKFVTRPSLSTNELTVFGENSASAIVIISVTPKELGTIVHANDEVNSLLGYVPKNVIGLNVSVLMPRLMGDVHNQFLMRYIESARPVMINKQNFMFGVTNGGYLKHLRFLVKIQPQLANKIILVGFIQELDKYQEMQPPKKEFKNHEQQYIMTDPYGNITNVTEGLNFELGLNSQFFRRQTFQHQNQVNLKQICPDIDDADLQEALLGDGTVLTIDTRMMIEFVEVEQLSSQELLEVKSKLGIYQAYIQLKKIEYGGGVSKANLYRIMLNSVENSSKTLTANDLASDTNLANKQYNSSNEFANKMSRQMSKQDILNTADAESSALAEDKLQQFSTQSSTQNSTCTYNKLLQDFKKVIANRKTPRNLILLNRITIGVFLILIALSCTQYSLKNSLVNAISIISGRTINTKMREFLLISLASNVRSFVNIANNLEDDYYGTGAINLVNRSQNLNSLIQSQANQIQAIQDDLSEQRTDSWLISVDAQHAQDLSDIPIYFVDQMSTLYSINQSYSASISLYLNSIQNMNQSVPDQIILPSALLVGSPYNDTESQGVTLMQRSIAYLLFNGLRSIRDMTMQATELQYSLEFNGTLNQTFMILMIVCLVIITFTVSLIIYEVWSNERNKGDILSLYSMLDVKEIKRVYDTCSTYLDRAAFVGGSLDEPLKLEHADSLKETIDENSNSRPIECYQENLSEQSEEIKEEKAYLQFIKQQRQLKIKKLNKQKLKAYNNHAIFGKDRYTSIIREAMGQMKGPNLEGIIEERIESFTQIKKDDVSKKTRRSKKRDSTKEDKIADENSNSYNNSELSGEIIEHIEDDIDDLPQIIGQQSEKEEAEERRQAFLRSSKNEKCVLMVLITLMGAVYIAQYLFGYIYHLNEMTQLNTLKSSAPLFFNRYSDLILGYSFMRERIINNNSLDSYYEKGSEFSPNDIDNFYMGNSIQDEQQVQSFGASSGIQILLNFMAESNSALLCGTLIGQVGNATNVSSANSNEEIITGLCSQFQNGILSNGIQPAIGVFQKKMADLQITISEGTSYSNLLNLLKDDNSTPTLPLFLYTNELYLHRIITSFVTVLQQAMSNFETSYSTANQSAFLVILFFQLVTLFFLRVKLISLMEDDVFQSRGTLNLIPEKFFKDNREAVEKLIKKLKD